jgi:nitrogen-specific signal transduction histidine kinase
MELQEFRKFAHDVKNHLTGATLQVQVMSMLLKDEHKDRLTVIADELQKAGDMMTEFQQTIKESQRKEREAQLDDLDEIDRKMEQKNS